MKMENYPGTGRKHSRTPEDSSAEEFFNESLFALKDTGHERKLRVDFANITPGRLQQIFDDLHAVREKKGWTVINQIKYQPTEEKSYIGVNKGPFILELTAPPEPAPEED